MTETFQNKTRNFHILVGRWLDEPSVYYRPLAASRTMIGPEHSLRPKLAILIFASHFNLTMRDICVQSFAREENEVPEC